MSESPTKPFWASKTIIANVAAVVAPFIASAMGMELPATELAVLAMAVVNIVLRFVTKKGVSVT